MQMTNYNLKIQNLHILRNCKKLCKLDLSIYTSAASTQNCDTLICLQLLNPQSPDEHLMDSTSLSVSRGETG